MQVDQLNIMENKIIKTELVEWEKLKSFQPIELKKMSKVQLDKIKISFKNNGFKSPFYVWQDKEILWVLDGHQRLPVLKLLRDEGEAIPDKLPANFVYCKNKKEAKKSVLIYNSHYADIQQDILADWIKDLDFDDIKLEIDIPDVDFSKIEQLFQPETNNDDDVPEDIKPIAKIGDLWELGRHLKSDLHSTMKPIALIENAILNSSEKENNITDLFLGSGSTLIACEKTNRICYGMELDEHYCDVIRDRYIKWCIDNNRPCSVKLNGKVWKSR